jgi:hypothetical protein
MAARPRCPVRTPKRGGRMSNSGRRSDGNRRGHGGRPARPHAMGDLDPRCRRMLDDAGFTYNARIQSWFNLKARRVIAFDRVAERTPEWLADWLVRK